MKASVLKVLALLLILTSQQSISQVTLLSNNTSLETGFVLNDKALFISRSDSFWVSDATPAGTVKLPVNVAYVDSSSGTIYKGKYYFGGVTAVNGIELWATDGTAAGTTLIKEINPGVANSTPAHFIVFNNTLFFTANDGTNGTELWSSDGTTAGTTLFKDINAGAPSAFTTLGTVNYVFSNGILYFTATTAGSGKELWKTDGTPAGTTMVKDITAGTPGTNFTQFINYGTNVIFGTSTGTYPLGSMQLWKTDGTSAGTTLIKDFGAGTSLFPPFFYLFNNKIYFMGTDATNGTELWVTDGTTAGTTLLKDINPGPKSSYPIVPFSAVINNRFYFTATTDAEGDEIWVSDGTAAGTQLFKDINPGVGDANPSIYVPFSISSTGTISNPLYNGKMFFSADNGTSGHELWMTDGTSAGTTMVKEIKPGSGGGLDSTGTYFYTTSGMYFSASDGVTGVEPWLTNGTSAGTNIVYDVNNGPAPSDPYYMFIYNNQLFFNANNGDDSTKTDLYKINGIVSALPITLLNLSATVEGKNAVKLDWTTTNEINSSHFEIERSIDGKNFSSINHVSASGNSSLNQNYTYTDYQAGNLNSSMLYYRLKSVDKDGSFKNSQVLLVRLQGGGFQFTFAPNPVQQQLNVSVSPAGAKSVAIRIIDANGKQVYQQALPTGVSAYQQNIDVTKLKTGIYYLQVITDNTIKVEKFVKQ
jgi:ELWxxDGT repeat protein